MHFYDTSDNINEKMSQSIYIDQILKSIIKPWLKTKQDFVLKKNDDSDHDPKKFNIVYIWKAQDKLKSYFNCAFSSDLSSIENCWQSSKIYLRKHLQWDNVTIKSLIYSCYWESNSLSIM